MISNLKAIDADNKYFKYRNENGKKKIINLNSIFIINVYFYTINIIRNGLLLLLFII